MNIVAVPGVEVLQSATGESCQVLALFLDIRGFSKFAGVAESTDTAIYLRDMYAQVLTDYFSHASYFKPTGDGLMIVRELPTHAEAVESALREELASAIRLVGDFPTMTDGNTLITIPVPDRIGIGIARGSATRLIAESGAIIDYSGRCLNLAARLMDQARPQGVVLSDRHARALLSEELLGALTVDSVFLKGVSEDRLVEILVTEQVVIPDSSRQPTIHKPSFDASFELSARKIRDNATWLIPCKREPRAGLPIVVHVRTPVYSAAGDDLHQNRNFELAATRSDQPEGPYARIELANVTRALAEYNVPDEKPVTFTPFH